MIHDLLGIILLFHLVRLSICGQNRVCSVSSTILVGSISYLHILSSNFRRCVTCQVFLSKFKSLKFWQILYICKFDFLFFWLGIQYDKILWVIMRWRGVSSERRLSSCSSWFSHVLEGATYTEEYFCAGEIIVKNMSTIIQYLTQSKHKVTQIL